MSDWLINNAQWVFSGIGVTIIGLCTAIIKVVQNSYLKRFQRIPKNQSTREVKTLLVGRWKGHSRIVNANKTITENNVTWSFRIEKGQIKCDSSSIALSDPGRAVDFDLEVNVMYDRFICVSYRNRDRSIINFGSEVMEIHENGNEFSGRFVGYSGRFRKIVSGDIHGHRS